MKNKHLAKITFMDDMEIEYTFNATQHGNNTFCYVQTDQKGNTIESLVIPFSAVKSIKVVVNGE